MVAALTVLVMVPVSFANLPALALVLIARTSPTCPLVGRAVPSPRHPLIASPLGCPIASDPGVARPGKRPAPLVADSRRWVSDIHRNLGGCRDGESSRQHQSVKAIQLHLYSLYYVPCRKLSKVSYSGVRWRSPSGEWL